VIVALLGQLAMLAHGALVEHVTCGADGELTHVRSGAAPLIPARDAVGAAVGSGDDAHDHCLLDEDGEAACPPTHLAAGEPAQAERSHDPLGRRARVVTSSAPLYRLAPKNSPPA
jgi:hypothetical protein